jgi:hypothetical protein
MGGGGEGGSRWGRGSVDEEDEGEGRKVAVAL